MGYIIQGATISNLLSEGPVKTIRGADHCESCVLPSFRTPPLHRN